jgi:N-acetylmuramoyl-L-alanine amidase
MATQYTVVQGDTILRIAKAHGFAKSDSIYQHADNAAYRELRPNPNVIYPGDIINIPDKTPKVVRRATNKTHRFVVSKPEVETLKIKLQNKAGDALQGKRITLSVGAQDLDVELGADGLLSIDLPEGTECEGELKVFFSPSDTEPTCTFMLELGHLDPVDELSGVQARCNLLGHDCGVVDGIMGSNTRQGIKAFQTHNSLEVDGIAGPLTQQALQKAYGC